jgi:hypothetical protein
MEEKLFDIGGLDARAMARTRLRPIPLPAAAGVELDILDYPQALHINTAPCDGQNPRGSFRALTHSSSVHRDRPICAGAAVGRPPSASQVSRVATGRHMISLALRAASASSRDQGRYAEWSGRCDWRSAPRPAGCGLGLARTWMDAVTWPEMAACRLRGSVGCRS